MLKDVEAYFAPIAETQEELDAAEAAHKAAIEAYDKTYAEFDRLRRAQAAAIEASYTERAEALKNSEDPMVKWIAENTLRSNRAYAEEILKRLPDTLENLDAYAQGAGWCSDWSRMVQRAVNDGVVAWAPVPAPVQEALDYIQRNLGSSYARTLRPALTKMAAQLTAAADTATEAASE